MWGLYGMLKWQVKLCVCNGSSVFFPRHLQIVIKLITNYQTN